jgi:predicted nucleic acid-binding protein
MLVVSDTSPLSNLAIIGRLDLLRQQFQIVRMPGGVTRELSALPLSAARFVRRGAEAIQSRVAHTGRHHAEHA